jgi:serine/threonine protein kinase
LTNILISSQGTAKLVDFGLAKIYSSLGAKESEKVERTVDYAGLEKATNVKSGDVRSDIYFLGCVLYEILCGKPPVPRTRDRFARMQKQRFDNVPPLSHDDVKAPASVFQLVETMMSLDPQLRFQTPSQLLEAIKAARRDVEGQGDNHSTNNRPVAGGVTHSVFVIESDTKLQNAIREKLKELGYRVLLASDPMRALDRFRSQPFDALIVDVRTVGEDGLHVFERILKDAQRRGTTLHGILVFSQEQERSAERVERRPNIAVFVGQITLKQLHRTLQKFFK